MRFYMEGKSVLTLCRLLLTVGNANLCKVRSLLAFEGIRANQAVEHVFVVS